MTQNWSQMTNQMVPDDPPNGLTYDDEQIVPDEPQMILNDSQIVQDDPQMILYYCQMVPVNLQKV